MKRPEPNSEVALLAEEVRFAQRRLRRVLPSLKTEMQLLGWQLLASDSHQLLNPELVHALHFASSPQALEAQGAWRLWALQYLEAAQELLTLAETRTSAA